MKILSVNNSPKFKGVKVMVGDSHKSKEQTARNILKTSNPAMAETTLGGLVYKFNDLANTIHERQSGSKETCLRGRALPDREVFIGYNGSVIYAYGKGKEKDYIATCSRALDENGNEQTIEEALLSENYQGIFNEMKDEFGEFCSSLAEENLTQDEKNLNSMIHRFY